jgi:hypothetical protein
MKRAIGIVAFLLAGVFALSALPADVTYSEGDATLKLKSGKQQDVQIGDVINTGDTLKTGKDGQAELNQKGVTIKISHGTVFTLMEKNQAGQTSTVLSVALGSIKLKYGKLSGSEPQVRTNGAVAGVRGTELSVFSGADGSSLFAVDSGQVTVESEGKSVDLVAEEGVEVPLGKPPGDKFTVHRDQIDYSKWNEDKLGAMLSDPEAAMTAIEAAMSTYEKDVGDFVMQFNEYNANLTKERAAMADISRAKGATEASKYNSDIVYPLMVKTLALGMNVRYSGLAALSLRRFVAGRLYIFVKAHLVTQRDSTLWTNFLKRYEALLSSFEKSIVPVLVEADI